MHRFGGRWTETKLSALSEYLKSYTTALKQKGFTLLYLDAFAGSGTFVKTGDGHSEVQSGSAQIALDVPGFHQYVFIEKDPRRCYDLRQLANRRTDVLVLEGDANQKLVELCDSVDWKCSRAVLFLDPYGLQVEWSTLKAVAHTQAIDVWYLFPLFGVVRQLARRESGVDADKRRSLDRVLGTDEWQQAFYEEPRTADMFGRQGRERHADTQGILDWLTGRLQPLFPSVRGPVTLRLSKKRNPASGPALFALYFLVSSPNEKARALACRIADGVFAKLRKDGAIS